MISARRTETMKDGRNNCARRRMYILLGVPTLPEVSNKQLRATQRMLALQRSRVDKEDEEGDHHHPGPSMGVVQDKADSRHASLCPIGIGAVICRSLFLLQFDESVLCH